MTDLIGSLEPEAERGDSKPQFIAPRDLGVEVWTRELVRSARGIVEIADLGEEGVPDR